jgi:hypothetical protein
MKKKAIFIPLPIFFFVISFTAQIPKRAFEMADSISKTRMLCATTKIELSDSIFYPIEKTKYQDRKTEIYFFQYIVFLKEDIKVKLNISINEDFSIKYINGVPDKNYFLNHCNILPRKKLWIIARKNGLRTAYLNCRYSILFNEKRIFIIFYQKITHWDFNNYTLDALTGEFLGHVKFNATF